MWMRAPVSSASATRRRVAFRAASGERQTGCEDGSPGTRRSLRARSIGSSSAWKAARRRIRLRISRTPASSSTRSEPVEEPTKTLMPAAPGRRSRLATSCAFSCVPPTQKAKSQCMR
ncbi:hypothetical protein AEGHOMDF_4135 [Methylobacterium soli]|nr:hypothetical protein AEGHOMDF_4135 [Methylobacterium soli]